jgi:polyisoprenoid-binding protein YceI
MATRTTWKIDPAHTAVEFSVKHMMFTTVRGRFSGVEGTIIADPDRPGDASVEVTIDAASIDTGSPDRDKHLRSADFLDVENNPTILFKSREARNAATRKPGERFTVIGDLTIRGERRPATLYAEYLGQGQDPWGGKRAGFSAHCEINRLEWGLKWNQTLETGGILVANEIKIQLDVQAVEQKEAATTLEAPD